MPVRESFIERVSIDVAGDWVEIPALGLQIKESTKSRIGEFKFRVAKVDIPDNVWAAIKLNARVQVYQAVGDQVDLFVGYINKRPRAVTGTVPTVEITGYQETIRATYIRFIDAWPSQTARNAGEIFLDAWTRYGPAGLDLSGIQVNGATVGPISSNLDTLFDFSEELCKRTGWAWQIRNGRVEFWDPGTVIAAGQLVEGDNIIAESLTVNEELPQVANVVFIPARNRIAEFPDEQPSRAGLAQYHLQYPPLLRQFEAGGETVYLDQPPRVWLDGVELTVAEDGSNEAATAQAIYNIENRWVRFNPGSVPAADGLTVTVVYTAELPVLVCRRNADSIAVFGEIHERIVRSPRPTREEAEQIGNAFLRERAFPIRPISLATTLAGLRPGMFVPVYIPSEGIDQLMPVLEVTRTSRPGNLDITVSLNQLPVSDDDLIFDLWRRLNRMEARETSRQERVEQYQDWQEEWTWEGSFTTTLNACSFPAEDLYPGEELYPC